jgi:N-acetylmuramoyl-L-alanine amidase
MTAPLISFRFFWVGVIALLAGALPSSALFINGQNYVPLADWSRANGFYGFTRNRGDEIVLTNKNSRLIFDMDSAQSQINGVNVRLSFPVANQKNIPFISQLDIETAIRPLIYPQKPALKKITTICLDPGHGGKDSGNRAPGFFSHYEKNYTLPLAFELRDQLQKLGFKVMLTRSADAFVELPLRPAIANARGADLFISLHFNAAQTDKNSVSGPETYCITPAGARSSNDHGENSEFSSTADTRFTTANRNEQKSLLFAYQMEKSLALSLNAEDRGVRRARFAVLRDATMPAILIEGGYMTNPLEGKKIYDAGYRKQMAAAIVRGILNYQKLTAPPPPPVQPSASNKNGAPKKPQ